MVGRKLDGCAYDAKSRRVKKVTPTASHTFVYDGWNLIEERVSYTDGTISAIHYYWGKDLSGTLQGAGGIGGLLYLTVDGTVYIPCYDNNGNITRYLDANGMSVAAYTYDVFGRTISQSGSLADVFRHRFSTKYFDIETGLYYYGYRFYHTVLMRWLNRDPIEEQGGKNLYQMVYNNPIVNVDSFGERVVVIKNVNPEMNWNMYEQAVTHFRIPSPYAIAIPTSKGRIRFELSDAPDVLVVNIYFRNADSSIWALPYEMAHVETAYALDAELQEFKRKVAAIEDCPRIAWEAYFDAWYIFDKARDTCRRRNQYIDRKGGPHDL